MARRLKLLVQLSTLAVAGAAALSACGGEGEGEGAEGEGSEGAKSSLSAPSAEGEGGGGSGGEGEGATASATDATDKPAYLSRLMMLHGHLKAGTALYAAGESSQAAVHMKHPHDELYMTLAPMMKAWGARDISPELNDLAQRVEGGMPVAGVEEAFASLRGAAARAAQASKPVLKETLLAAALTLRQAAAEYEEGVQDGAVVNPKEYQDAYGFVAVVVETLGGVEGADEAEKTAVAVAREQAALALAVAPTVAPPAKPEGKASTIYAAATRIELAALGLD
jgi:hypothetical protein